MKFILVSAIILVILPFNICFGNSMTGSPSTIEVNQVDHLKITIEDFIKSNQNGNEWIYVNTVEKATAQVVAGTLYRIEFVAAKTDCFKNNLTNSKEKCKVKNQQNCSVSIWEKEWENFVKIISMNCFSINFGQ